MVEAFSATSLSGDKAQRYEELSVEIASVLSGEADETARMATIVAMLKASFATYFWVGFYRVDRQKPSELVIGPYQGTLGCLRIPFGRGVCGAVAQSRSTLIVPDVDAFPGHIACDSQSRSEIVVPVLDPSGALIAVLDVDSDQLDAFDPIDAAGLERILSESFAR